MRISDWSSDVCSSDLARPARARDRLGIRGRPFHAWPELDRDRLHLSGGDAGVARLGRGAAAGALSGCLSGARGVGAWAVQTFVAPAKAGAAAGSQGARPNAAPALERKGVG